MSVSNLVLCFMLISSMVLADEAQCLKTVQACNSALEEQRKVNGLQSQIISDQNQRHELEAQEISDLKSSNNNILRQPWLWFCIGAVTGGYIVSRVR